VWPRGELKSDHHFEPDITGPDEFEAVKTVPGAAAFLYESLLNIQECLAEKGPDKIFRIS